MQRMTGLGWSVWGVGGEDECRFVGDEREVPGEQILSPSFWFQILPQEKYVKLTKKYLLENKCQIRLVYKEECRIIWEALK